MTALVRDVDFLRDNFLSTDHRYKVSLIGTNICASLATNAISGNVWDNFSSFTYKKLPSVGTIGITDPFAGDKRPYDMPDGGRGYQRAPSLISMWASAPYLHNNSVGLFNGDPSVAGRMAAFQDGIEKLLWPEKRLGLGSIYRTTERSWLTIHRSYLPTPLFQLLKGRGLGSPGSKEEIRLGPIPKGIPVNLIANIDLELSHNPAKTLNFIQLAIALDATLRDIRTENLDDTTAAARLNELGPALLKLSKCPDLVTDSGHLFGTGLPDEDKHALIAFLKRL